MADEEKQEGQKTVTSFIVGLLIGGLLVWTFSGPAVDNTKNNSKDTKEEKEKVESKDKNEDGEVEEVYEEVEEEDEIDEEEEVEVEKTQNNSTVSTNNQASVITSLPVGDGKVKVDDQAPSSAIKLTSATYPVSEGWIGVRDYQDEKLGGILGVVRFSEEQGLIPSEIILQRPTVAGKNYAVVIFTEDGDRIFNLAGDKQIDKIFDTFTAK